MPSYHWSIFRMNEILVLILIRLVHLALLR